MTTPSRHYIYIEDPHTREWVTAGRYTMTADGIGQFRYSNAYLERESAVAIDPINLPLSSNAVVASRYEGLHDILRDACPDSWGQALIKREYELPDNAPLLSYLLKANNADRWGALAIGTSKSPSVSHLNSPKLPELELLARELLAMSERLPPINVKMRRRIMATPSLGGARPKATVQDGRNFWLAKPVLSSDVLDVPLLEHAMQQWATAAGLNFAPTQHISYSKEKGMGLSVMLSLRFDRPDGRRALTLSGASMLQAEYPNSSSEQTARWSYPRLANALARTGAPVDDRFELFNRMVFNALIGNDDDHPRNHAARYVPEERRWRLAPAFDVVPESVFTPRHSCMALGRHGREISRENILSDAMRFGFESVEAAASHMDSFLLTLKNTYEQIRPALTEEMDQMMVKRLDENMEIIAPGLT